VVEGNMIMNKRYVAVLINGPDGLDGWAVQCEHMDGDFHIETIARCNPNNPIVGSMWAQRIADALNHAELCSALK
jgi:hypothetical protein